MNGRLTMARNPLWTVYLPWGGTLSTTGTQTDGLQEAINYAIEHRFELDVIGSHDDVITCSVGLRTLPLEGAKWRVGPVTIEFPESVTYALEIDTAMHCDIEWLAKHRYSGTSGAAVRFNPVNPIGSTIAIKHNRIKMLRAALFTGGQWSCGVQFRPIGGEISTNDIDLGEIEGGHGGNVSYMGDGVQVLKPQNGQNFVENDIRAFITHFTGCGLRIGDDGSTINGQLQSNIWNVRMHAPVGSQAAGVSTWEHNGDYTLSMRGANLNTGMNFQPSAAQNICRVRRNDAAIKYAGGWQSNTIIQ